MDVPQYEKMMDAIIISVLTPSEEEALNIANTLVKRHLAGAVNISKVHSIYYWKEKIYDRQEWLLLIKTRRERFEEIKTEVTKLHSYEVPEIVAFPIISASDAYIQWLKEVT